jgi:hypothetical protein
MRLRRQLEETYGMEGASQLLDDRPPGGWQAVVTREYLDLRLESLESRLRGEIVEVRADLDRRMRQQTWVMASMLIAGLGLFGLTVQL